MSSPSPSPSPSSASGKIQFRRRRTVRLYQQRQQTTAEEEEEENEEEEDTKDEYLASTNNRRSTSRTSSTTVSPHYLIGMPLTESVSSNRSSTASGAIRSSHSERLAINQLIYGRLNEVDETEFLPQSFKSSRSTKQHLLKDGETLSSSSSSSSYHRTQRPEDFMDDEDRMPIAASMGMGMGVGGMKSSFSSAMPSATSGVRIVPIQSHSLAIHLLHACGLSPAVKDEAIGKKRKETQPSTSVLTSDMSHDRIEAALYRMSETDEEAKLSHSHKQDTIGLGYVAPSIHFADSSTSASASALPFPSLTFVRGRLSQLAIAEPPKMYSISVPDDFDGMHHHFQPPPPPSPPPPLPPQIVTLKPSTQLSASIHTFPSSSPSRPINGAALIDQWRSQINPQRRAMIQAPTAHSVNRYSTLPLPPMPPPPLPSPPLVHSSTSPHRHHSSPHLSATSISSSSPSSAQSQSVAMEAHAAHLRRLSEQQLARRSGTSSSESVMTLSNENGIAHNRIDIKSLILTDAAQAAAPAKALPAISSATPFASVPAPPSSFSSSNLPSHSHSHFHSHSGSDFGFDFPSGSGRRIKGRWGPIPSLDEAESKAFPLAAAFLNKLRGEGEIKLPSDTNHLITPTVQHQHIHNQLNAPPTTSQPQQPYTRALSSYVPHESCAPSAAASSASAPAPASSTSSSSSSFLSSSTLSTASTTSSTSLSLIFPKFVLAGEQQLQTESLTTASQSMGGTSSTTSLSTSSSASASVSSSLSSNSLDASFTTSSSTALFGPLPPPPPASFIPPTAMTSNPYDAAALRGEFGKSTREVIEWAPHSLVFKRFGVPMPTAIAASITRHRELEKMTPTSSTQTATGLPAFVQSQSILTHSPSHSSSFTSSVDHASPRSTDIEEEKNIQASFMRFVAEEDESVPAGEESSIIPEEKPTLDLFKAIFAGEDEEDEDRSQNTVGKLKAHSKSVVPSNSASPPSASAFPSITHILDSTDIQVVAPSSSISTATSNKPIDSSRSMQQPSIEAREIISIDQDEDVVPLTGFGSSSNRTNRTFGSFDKIVPTSFKSRTNELKFVAPSNHPLDRQPNTNDRSAPRNKLGGLNTITTRTDEIDEYSMYTHFDDSSSSSSTGSNLGNNSIEYLPPPIRTHVAPALPPPVHAAWPFARLSEPTPSNTTKSLGTVKKDPPSSSSSVIGPTPSPSSSSTSHPTRPTRLLEQLLQIRQLEKNRRKKSKSKKEKEKKKSQKKRKNSKKHESKSHKKNRKKDRQSRSSSSSSEVDYGSSSTDSSSDCDSS